MGSEMCIRDSSLVALSSIVFVSMTFGIGVRVVAEGVLVGNIATENYQNKENEQPSISHQENVTDTGQNDYVNQFEP